MKNKKKKYDPSGAGFTLMTGYLFGPFIPFKDLKNYKYSKIKKKRR